MNAIEKVYSTFQKHRSICTDSRTVEPGAIFFALRGENFDGNRFIEVALEKGASLAITDSVELKDKHNTVFVPNTLTFLQDLARYHRAKLSIPIIGLTGSNGKTTTKELINQVLSSKFRTVATRGNLNNHIGVPLTVISILPDTEIAIVEMGANHIGEIALLCSIAQPTHGLITNIGKAHLEGFGSFEGVKRGKSELYEFLARNSGSGFINGENPILHELADAHGLTNLVYYGVNQFNLRQVNSGSSFLSFNLSFKGKEYGISTKLVGSYNIENILAAIIIGHVFGVEVSDCISAIEGYVPTNNRSQIFKSQNNTIILDAYNANPSSMELALRNFSDMETDLPKMVILGEMLELGEFSDSEHERIARLALDSFENIVLVGKNFAPMSSHAAWFPSQHELSVHLKESPIAGHTILMKGSRGVRLDEVVKFL
ncbi:MAG: UDP-N-acetylmuramoyl-tripeptide--D-alanyl-D-alanine ligase [Tenuifilaceae bacterium]|jgi:UDP-N-acetylmuramoyl-tripeptide--D-alanyl-D-alanine ligase|nr:UDP-N-acetylmuramoyl-tripeptide--D-alanyl-D-alanine ligase [Tenuifilaceae bacterium]